MLDFAANPHPVLDERFETLLVGSGCRHAVIEDQGDFARLTFFPDHNRMTISAGLQATIRENGLIHLRTLDDGRGDVVMEFAGSMPLRPGFHVLSDRETHAHVVAMSDGTSWWMPGSSLAFPDETVARKCGRNRNGRFHHVSPVRLPDGAADWSVTSGRFH